GDGCVLRAVSAGAGVRSVEHPHSPTTRPGEPAGHGSSPGCAGGPDDRSAGMSRADVRKLLIRTVQSNALPRLSCVLLLSLACSASPPPAGGSDSMADASSGADAPESSDGGDEESGDAPTSNGGSTAGMTSSTSSGVTET